MDERDYGDMSQEEFRLYGHRLIDWIADYLDDVTNLPVSTDVDPNFLLKAFPSSPPTKKGRMSDILSDLDRVIMPGITHWNSPRFMGYFNSSGSGPGVLGELVCGALNVNAMHWQSCPSATELEQLTLGWLKDMLGLCPEFFGVIYDGGSNSTLHAIAAAREHAASLNVRDRGMGGRNSVPRLRVYTSDLGHSSVDKAAVTLGIGLDNVRRIAVNDHFQMDPTSLDEAIEEDRTKGILPFCVVATVGSTSCTSIDPVAEIADICLRQGLWLHVDAAYGGAAAVVPELSYVLDGCNFADSIVINPHKWLFVPLDLSVLFIRKPEVLKRAFQFVPEYLRTQRDDEVVNFMDYGIPLGRRFRSLKLWFVIRYFGIEGIANRIREHIRLGRQFANWIDAHPDFERLAPVPLSTVCFRAVPQGVESNIALDILNKRLLEAVNSTGEAYLSHTILSGRYTIRMVVSHIRTREEDTLQVWKTIQTQLGKITDLELNK